MKKIFSQTLLCLIFSIFISCGKKEYKLKCDNTVPRDLAQVIEGKTYFEGDNPFLGEEDDQIIITIKNGKIAGFKQNMDGKYTPIIEESQTTALDDKGDPQSPIRKCETQFIECTASCGPAPLDPDTINPTRDNCLKTCRGNRIICLLKAGSLSRNIGVIRN